jgi:hypothetical protein
MTRQCRAAAPFFAALQHGFIRASAVGNDKQASARASGDRLKNNGVRSHPDNRSDAVLLGDAVFLCSGLYPACSLALF